MSLKAPRQQKKTSFFFFSPFFLFPSQSQWFKLVHLPPSLQYPPILAIASSLVEIVHNRQQLTPQKRREKIIRYLCKRCISSPFLRTNTHTHTQSLLFQREALQKTPPKFQKKWRGSSLRTCPRAMNVEG